MSVKKFIVLTHGARYFRHYLFTTALGPDWYLSAFLRVCWVSHGHAGALPARFRDQTPEVHVFRAGASIALTWDNV